jgi:hypothetical protein
MQVLSEKEFGFINAIENIDNACDQPYYFSHGFDHPKRRRQSSRREASRRPLTLGLDEKAMKKA